MTKVSPSNWTMSRVEVEMSSQGLTRPERVNATAGQTRPMINRSLISDPSSSPSSSPFQACYLTANEALSAFPSQWCTATCHSGISMGPRMKRVY